MKRSLSRILALSLISLPMATLISCSAEDSTDSASLRDIVTPGDPTNGANRLLWIDAEKLTRGACKAGATFNRANCSASVVSRPIAESQTQATAALEQAVTALTQQQTAEVQRLKSADPQVVSLTNQINALTREKSDLERNIATSTQQLTALQTEQATKQASLKDYEAQVAAINERLKAEPDNRDLLVLREQLMKEHDAIAVRLAFIANAISETEAKLKVDRDGLADATKDLQDLQNELKAVMDAIVPQSPALEQLKAQIAHKNNVKGRIAAVIALLGSSDIIYRDNLLNAVDREALVALDATLGASGSILAGRYRDTKGYFCPQRLIPGEQGGVLKTVEVTFLSPCGNEKVPMTCNGLSCSGKYGSYTFGVAVTGKDTYDFIRNNETNRGKFVREGNVE